MRFKSSPRFLATACALVVAGAAAATGVTIAHAAAGPPTVTGVSPTSGNTEGVQQVTITGTNFFNGGTVSAVTAVTFGGTNYKVSAVCPTTGTPTSPCFGAVSDTDTSITAYTPSHPGGPGHLVDVTVTTAAGTSVVNAPADQFDFVAPTPQPASLSVHTGLPGTSITISPVNGNAEASGYDWPTDAIFTPPSGSSLDVPLSSSNVQGDLIKLQAPPAGSGMQFGVAYDVQVTTSGGNQSPKSPSTDQFTFMAAPFVPTNVGAPAITVATDGTQLIFWQGAGGHLIEAWWNGSWNGPVDWTAANGWGYPLASAPSVKIDSNGVQLVFWKAANGHLIEAWYANGWNGPVDWTAANGWGATMSSAPSATIDTHGTQLIFWQGSNGHLIEVWYANGWNGPVDWTAANHWGTLLASAASVTIDSHGTQLVFWTAANGHLTEAWWANGWNGPVDVTSSYFGNSNLATSAPTVTVTGSIQLIFWQGAGGHLVEAWWAGAWNGPVDLTSAYFGGGGLLTSAPAVAMSGSTQLVFWQGSGSHLVEAWYAGGWNGPRDWSS